MNGDQFAFLINSSMVLLIASVIPLLAFFAYIVLNSPIATPLVRARAERAFKRQKYALAAKLFLKLQDWQHILEGNVYARKAAQSLEMTGSIKQAIECYRWAEDWPKVGQLLQETGQLEEAKQVYSEHQLFARLALCYEQEGKFLEVGKLYEQELDNLHKAEQHYKKAASNPDPESYLQARLFLARLYVKMQRQEEAQSLLEQVNSEMDASAQYQEFPELQALRAEVSKLL